MAYVLSDFGFLPAEASRWSWLYRRRFWQYQPKRQVKARAARTTEIQISIVKWEEGDIMDWFRICSNSFSVTAKFLRLSMSVLKLLSWSSKCPVAWSNSDGSVSRFRSHSNCSGLGVILMLSFAVIV